MVKNSLSIDNIKIFLRMILAKKKSSARCNVIDNVSIIHKIKLGIVCDRRKNLSQHASIDFCNDFIKGVVEINGLKYGRY